MKHDYGKMNATGMIICCCGVIIRSCSVLLLLELAPGTSASNVTHCVALSNYHLWLMFDQSLKGTYTLSVAAMHHIGWIISERYATKIPRCRAAWIQLQHCVPPELVGLLYQEMALSEFPCPLVKI